MEGSFLLRNLQLRWIREASEVIKHDAPGLRNLAELLLNDDVLDAASITLLDAAIDHELLDDDLRSFAMEMLENGGFGRSTPWATERLLKG